MNHKRARQLRAKKNARRINMKQRINTFTGDIIAVAAVIVTIVSAVAFS